MLRGAIAAFCAWCVVACAPAPTLPRNAAIAAGAPLPQPIFAASGSKPKIVAMRYTSNNVALGGTWAGTVVTTTNVASVEVRTNLFTIDVPRRRFGVFAFRLNLLDVPPIFIRAYRLRVIARNAAGDETEEDMPFRIRPLRGRKSFL